ncbi:hypothetical protein K2X83_01075 [Patescibacteria group bacterium]|nr:hypothetical protein [Patescibacteria group bacterium]
MKAFWLRIILLVAVGIVTSLYFFPRTEENAARNVSDVRSSIEKALQKSGPSQTYADLKERYRKSHPDTQHNLAHIFGESLYTYRGAYGISICDPDFNFGCYHGFFTAAVKREGFELISQLDAVCQTSSRPSACQHGLGHGIMEYVGHGNLTKALEACSRTYQPDPVAGCTSGVFMDYNIPLHVEGDTFTLSPRPLGNPPRPFSPCTDVDSKFRSSCYHELPQWWNQVYEGDVQNIGALCESVEPPEYARQCFHGIGNLVGSIAGYDVQKTQGLCALLPENAQDTCFVAAASSFSANIGDREGATHLCGSVSLSAREVCLKNL